MILTVKSKNQNPKAWVQGQTIKASNSCIRRIYRVSQCNIQAGFLLTEFPHTLDKIHTMLTVISHFAFFQVGYYNLCSPDKP